MKGVNAKIVLRDLDLLFECKILFLISLKLEELAQKFVEVFCSFLHLLSDDILVRIVLRDLDLLF